MEKKIINRIKFFITVAIIVAFVWFLVISPMITFHNNEKKMEDAARRYFELNTDKLPTGERVKTITLKELYNDAYLKEDFFSPYTKKSCSITNSWVKVKRENKSYKYYVYLDCGVLNSSVDHEGPQIKLNGDSTITLGVGEEYKELGVHSIVDNGDGKIDVKNITIRGSVNNSKVGSYEIQYSATDKLNNRTVVTREVNVVKTLNSVVKKDLGNTTNYIGNPTNTYIRLSNMIFRMFGLDSKDNVVIVADEDVANVNFTKIDDWLEYYYEHLNSKTRKMIVKSKFCNMNLSDSSTDSLECSSYTDLKKVYIPSAIEVNKAQAGDTNFMKPATMSWVSNKKSAKEAYVTRNIFYAEEYGKSFLAYDTTFNYGIRPMMVISGKSLITGGSGTASDPYVFGDSKAGRGGELVNTRSTGEYITDSGVIWRIVDSLDDGTVKVISNDTLGSGFDKIETYPDPDKKKINYNPTDKTSVAYFINNNVGEYIDTSKFVNHEIEVPIYKNKIIYGSEIDVKKYKAKLSAPNMYEMFSAQTKKALGYFSGSYWLINTSNADRVTGAITGIGVPLNEVAQPYLGYGVRVVAYLKKDVVISSGKGTIESPYKIN